MFKNKEEVSYIVRSFYTDCGRPFVVSFSYTAGFFAAMFIFIKVATWFMLHFK
jgi:hypothetical protein